VVKVGIGDQTDKVTVLTNIPTTHIGVKVGSTVKHAQHGFGALGTPFGNTALKEEGRRKHVLEVLDLGNIPLGHVSVD